MALIQPQLGDAAVVIPRQPKEFFDRAEKVESGCLEWKHRSPDGYGRLQWGRKTRLAHRVAMHLVYGFDLDSKAVICHHCDNPSCVNVDHLYVGTMKQNMQDMFKRGRAVRTAKLSIEKALIAVEMFKDGQTKTEVARHFGVSMQTIRFILNRYADGRLGITKRRTK